MAWVRTLIAVAGTWTLVAFHLVHDHDWILAAALAALVAAVAVASSTVVGRRRTACVRYEMSVNRRVDRPTQLLLVLVVVVGATVLAFMTAVTSVTR